MSLEAIEMYFRRIYWGRTLGGDGLDTHSILPRLHRKRADLLMPYESVARDMRLIPDGTEAIIIPWDDAARQLLAELEDADRVGHIARRLQRYVVTVYPKDFQRLRDAHAIGPVAAGRFGEQFWVLTDARRYHSDLGLDIWQHESGNTNKEDCMGVRLMISGPLACFSRPELSVERVSYDVMTPSAAVGVLEAIYWKPAIYWHVDRITVLRPIKTMQIKRNEVTVRASARRQAIDVADTRNRIQRTTLALRDVSYIIDAHFE